MMMMEYRHYCVCVWPGT